MNHKKVAVLGASGIGRIYARLLCEQGVRVTSILGSSVASAERTSEVLNRTYGIHAVPYCSLPELLAGPNIDAVFVCLPPALHRWALDGIGTELPIFCEKPLLWQSPHHTGAMHHLAALKASCIKLMLSLPTKYFLQDILHKYKCPVPASFAFTFHTNGGYRYEDIGADLLPHAVSCIHELYGVQNIRNLHKNITETSFSLSADYGDAHIEFSFLQDKAIPKKMQFSFDGTLFTRIQKGNGASYKVYFSNAANVFEVTDPFKRLVRRFIENISSQSTDWLFFLDEAIQNMETSTFFMQ